MATSYLSLLDGAGWHTGNGTITYSFLGSSVPSYYDTVDTNGDLVDDAYLIHDLDTTVPIGASVSMPTDYRVLAELAVQAWNEVANVNMQPGNISGGSGTTTTGSAITGDGTLVGGLGGALGYGEIEINRNDDGYQLVDISSVFENGLNFFGTTASSMYVNTNGSISFGSGISTFTPTTISGGLYNLIAPFWADVDTRAGNPIYVDLDPTADVVTITWSDVGYFSYHTDLLNSFQLQLYDRGNGDFDIVFRYDDINWTTGDASGGTGGLGGTVTHAGYSAGNGSDYYELPQSGSQSAILNLENTVGNTGTVGLWTFEVRNGEIGVGDITFGSYAFVNQNGTANTGLYGFVADFPTGGTLGTASPHGDVWINTNNTAQAVNEYGHDSWMTYLHELGHGLGLHHPDEDPFNTANDPTNNNQYTVMSYMPHPSEASESSYDMAWPLTPMVYDIQAIQALYGANLTTRTANTTYFGDGDGTGQLAYQYGADNMILNGRDVILTIWDAGGTDLIDASDMQQASIINLAPGAYSTIGAIANNVGIATAVYSGGSIVNLIENANGGAYNDTIYGNLGNNVLNGNGGNDNLFGREGNDRLDGGIGADNMFGGAGSDVYRVDNVGDRVFENENEGWDRVESFISFALRNHSNHIETLWLLGTDNIDGTGNSMNNSIVGNSGNNILNGAWGNDILIGGAGNDRFFDDYGADRMEGGLGDDVYRVDNLGDRVIELANEGWDRVEASVSFSLRDHSNYLETLWLTGSNDINGTGNGLNNSIVGNWGNNILNGAWGNDVLIGGAGNDRFFDDYGADRMEGGTGDDIYRVDNFGDQVIELANEGWDRVESSISFSLRQHSNYIEALWLTGTNNTQGIGNGLNNYIRGNSGDNLLNGAWGNDTLVGGTGADHFLDDAGVEWMYAGDDTDEDIFQFTNMSQSGVGGGQRDQIFQFDSGEDIIDLSAIDANWAVAGNQAFAYSGFNAIANGIWFWDVGDNIIINVDASGDAIADMQIELQGVDSVVWGDFML
ncbi:nidogen-like domain-containing protein [uncultured Cohaesibacter sp.]|uniref:nidogen-like domain-containing protein n=1 Tax=uncultured Cohaesibacter sp. TaxID=1002546 RepID=UPI0029C7FCFE|nr:nidogen-like domain-containing protein [uncultured Cohaesibacter sp.]